MLKKKTEKNNKSIAKMHTELIEKLVRDYLYLSKDL